MFNISLDGIIDKNNIRGREGGGEREGREKGKREGLFGYT